MGLHRRTAGILLPAALALGACGGGEGAREATSSAEVALGEEQQEAGPAASAGGNLDAPDACAAFNREVAGQLLGGPVAESRTSEALPSSPGQDTCSWVREPDQLAWAVITRHETSGEQAASAFIQSWEEQVGHPPQRLEDLGEESYLVVDADVGRTVVTFGAGYLISMTADADLDAMIIAMEAVLDRLE